MARMLEGKPVAEQIKADITKRVDALKSRGVEPTLAILRVGNRADDLAYESSLLRSAESLGINVNVFAEDVNTSQARLLEMVDEMNADESIHGCLIFRPLTKGIDEIAICNRLDAKKDIDGCTDISLAGVFSGRDLGYAPATAEAVMRILDHYGIAIAGKRVVVIGRSLVIGRPVAMLALDRDASVSVCHSKTEDIGSIIGAGDVIICATGRSRGFSGDLFRSGQIVIDVGMNIDDQGRLCGDVDTESVACKVGAITPVPGGVGSVTTAVLLEHVVSACERIHGVNDR